MSSLKANDYQRVLELAAEALRCAGPSFPDVTMTGLLRDVFQADFAGAGQVDLLGTASRTWADSPDPIPVRTDGFHEYAISHPLTLAYRRTGDPVPLRISDVTSAQTAPPPYGGTNMSRLLTIPLTVTPVQICTVVLLRSGNDFTTRDLRMACQLHPILTAVYGLSCRLAQHPPGHAHPERSSQLTTRELAVLNLMADGLITAAIGRRLGISPHTVNKHIERIYRKLGTHDRTTTVLRGEALGFLRR